MTTPRRWAWLEGSAGIAAAVLATLLLSSRAKSDPPAAPLSIRVGLAPSPRVQPLDEPPFPAIRPLDARFDDDASLPAHAVAVHHTTLRATLDPSAHVIHGEGAIDWRNTSTEPATELWFHLYLNAFKNERTRFLRERLGEGRGSRLPSDWGYLDVKRLTLRSDDGSETDLWTQAETTSPGDTEDETDVRVPLPAPCAAGASLHLSLSFDAKLPTVVTRTGYVGSFHMAGQWFPQLARRTHGGAWSHFAFDRLSEFDADFGSYDVTIDVPRDFVVGATGVLSSRVSEGARSVSTYHADDVHDFAFTAWDEWIARSVTMGGVDVVSLAPPGHDAAVDRELDAARSSLGCYGRRFGRYPYSSLTIVRPPLSADEAGGMEYPTLITTGGVWAGPPLLHLSEWVTVHELGHQTFFGLLATDEHRSPFLDEGVNSYAEMACMDALHGPGSLFQGMGAEISVEAAHREGAAESHDDDVIARGAAEFPSWNAYAKTVYSRTATLLQSLGGAFGRDVVERALGRYARAYRFQHPDARHLLAAFADVGGDDLREALRAGLFDRGWVDFAVSDVYSAKHTSALGVFDRSTGRETVARRSEEDGYDGWALVVRRGNLVLPVDVDLLLSDGSTTRTHWNGVGEWTRITYQGPLELVGAIVDPEGKLPIDDDFANNARSLDPSFIAYRTWERSAYLLALVSLATAP